MRTTVVVHTTGWASYVRWVDALRRWCLVTGQGVTAEVIDEIALDSLEVSEGHPAGAEQVAQRSSGDELWTWKLYSHTTITYLIRDRRSWVGTRTRSVIILEYETTLPDGSS